MKKNIFVIDGNYFAHRTIGVLNMGDQVNNLESPTEISQLKAALNSSLLNLMESMSKYVNNFIFCIDDSKNLWRKAIEPVRPYYLKGDTITPLKYKENRKAKKEESSLNYDNFNLIVDEFVETLKARMIVFHVNGLESDDLFLLIGSKFKEYKDKYFGIGFCTDGDLNQTVNDNFILFRNIKSKEVPEGEFVITKKLYEKIFEGDAKSQLIGNSIEKNYFTDLFTISLRSQYSVKRHINEGITLCTPFKVALIKSICGDKKDNIFPLIRWVKGMKNYSVTKKMIEKALKKSEQYLTEITCQQILTTKGALQSLIKTVIGITKQPNIEIQDLGEHLKHNLRMIILSKPNLPQSSIMLFEEMWKGYESQLSQNFDMSQMKLNIDRKDSATNVLESSIPEILN